MIDWLRAVRAELAARVATFDPSVVRPADAAVVFEAAAELEVAFAGLALLTQARACEADTWRDEGAASPDAWAAAKTGRTRSEAADAEAASRRMADTPHLAAALRSGTLSPAQATVVSAAAAADPDAEARLVDRAGTTTVEQLRRDSRNVIAAAQPCELAAQQRRAHERRCLTTRTDPDGSIIGHFRLTAIAGARLHAAIAPFHQDLFDQARREGRRETHAAIAADALVAMATAATTADASTGGRRPATIVARVDLDALQRGHTLPGEESSIDGVGPVPVPTIAALVTDAVIVALARRGEQIVDVRLAGRAMPARLRHAVIARDRHCVVPGCDRDRHCEIHHLHQVGHGGDTFLANLALVCTWHHDQLTHSGATLVRDDRPAGQPGGFTYTPTPATHPPGSPFDDDNLTWHPSHPPPVPA